MDLKKTSIAVIIVFALILLAFGFGKLSSHSKKKGLVEYIQNPKRIERPTLQDYRIFNIPGVDKNNIDTVNKEISQIVTGQIDFNTIGVYYGRHYPTYRYDTSKDYIYDFNQSSATTLPVEIKNSSISFDPKKIYRNSSVFLKVRIESDTIGRLFPPTLTAVADDKKSVHTFEHGARGIRYINLSDLPLDTCKKIVFKSRFLSIPDQTTKLYIFKNDNLNGKKIVVIAPHPDDAEIAAFGLYSTYHENSYVFTITAGDAGPDTIYRLIYKNRDAIYHEKGYHRTWDSISIPALGRVSYDNTLNLGFFDGRLAQMYRQKNKIFSQVYTQNTDPGVFRAFNHSPLNKELTGSSNWISLIDSLTNLLQKIKPDIIVTPYPRLDRHPDHKYASVALFEAIKKAGIHSGKLFLYTNHPTMSEYFPFGPRGKMVDLPPFFNRLYFDSIYSFPLIDSIQKRKLFALEAMSDLRFEYDGNPLIPKCKGKDPLTCRDFSYFRRAVRKNELFFVIDLKRLYDENISEQIFH